MAPRQSPTGSRPRRTRNLNIEMPHPFDEERIMVLFSFPILSGEEGGYREEGRRERLRGGGE